VIEEKPVGPPTLLETNQLEAWRLSDSEKRITSSNRAISQLLQQADELMAAANFEQASDKLERLVRIEPQFAQAWSRLSWMALKNGDAQRSQQLAQRSNSYSRDNNKLKILNWNFIKQAGELLQSVELVEQAEQMIKALGGE